MLSQLVAMAPHLPDRWGEGSLFAFSGMDGETNAASGFVGAYARQPYGLLFHTPLRRLLEIAVPEPATPRLATGDVYGVETPAGELVVAYSAWHTLIGILPEEGRLSLRAEDGTEAEQQGGLRLSADPAGRDVLALARQGGQFALSYGRSTTEAAARAQAGLAADVAAVAAARLAGYRRLPSLPDPERSRLLNKCFSVMRVNTLSPEGVIARPWSTPDRVPHRDMWLWDSVFHSLAMNFLQPKLARQFLLAVLDTQTPAGLIPHQTSVSGWQSDITQPPLLAWAVWENYIACPERAYLAEALPRLERYLEWDLAHRDRNGNGLLEWHISGDERCRSGESGMDNSPRFDRALLLDAVDFSSFAAHDMHHCALIARELGLEARAALWQQRAGAMSAAVHRGLWSEAEGFYFDRDMEGRLSPVWAVSGFMPLLLEDVPPGHLAGLAQALDDPRLFNSAFPVPSVALADPAWSTDMWRGATWLNTNYMLIRGLRRHGRADLAARLRETTLAMVDKYYRRYGVTFEFYDAADRVPPTECDRKGRHQAPYDLRRKMDSIRDYHWTAALTACLLMEE